MGRKVCILLGFLLVFSLSWSVECASLQRHFRSQRDVLPAILKPDLPFNGTDQSLINKTNTTNLNITNNTKNELVQGTENSDTVVKKNIEEEVKEGKGITQEKKNIEEKENKEDELQVVEEKNNDKDSNGDKGDKIVDSSPKTVEPLLETKFKLPVQENPEDNNETKQSGKETGRALNIDIEKYVSPEFHNKNNVYILPTSPEIQKYLDPDTPDYTDHITESDFHSSSHDYDFNLSSTTPLGDLLDSKFRQVADSIKQNLDEFDSNVKEVEEKHEEKEDIHEENKYDVPTLIDNVKNKDNDTEVSLQVVETKNVEQKSEEKKGKKTKDTSIESGRNVDYKSSFVKTKTYDDKSDSASPNNISDSKEDKTTEQSIESTIKKVKLSEPDTEIESSTKSSKKPEFSLNNTIDSKDAVKSKSLRQFTLETSTAGSREIIYTKPATDNSINISKRGSTKYLDSVYKSTTPTPGKGIDFDDKGYSIPPSATAWSLATLKDVGTNETEPSTTKIPKEQIVEENNVIKITIPPPQVNEKSTENIFPDIITTDFILNTDVITTETPPKTTPTLFWTTIQDKQETNKTDSPQKRIDDISPTSSLIPEASTKSTQKMTQKSENEILKTSEELPEVKSTNSEDSIQGVSLDTTPFVIGTTQRDTIEDSTDLLKDVEKNNSTTEGLQTSSESSSTSVKTTLVFNNGSSTEKTTTPLNNISSTVVVTTSKSNSSSSRRSSSTSSYQTTQYQTTTDLEVTTIDSLTEVVTTESLETTTQNEMFVPIAMIPRIAGENGTQQTNKPKIESITESPLMEEEGNTKNAVEEKVTTIKNTERTSDNEVITTKTPENSTIKLGTNENVTVSTKIENSTSKIPTTVGDVSSTSESVLVKMTTSVKMSTSSETVSTKVSSTSENAISGTTEPFTPIFNIEKKKYSPSLPPIQEVDEESNVEEIDNDYEERRGPMEPPIKIYPTEEPTTQIIDKTTKSIQIEVTTHPTTQSITETTKSNMSTTDPTTGTEMLSHDETKDESNPGMVAAIAISAVAAVCLVLLAGLLIVMRKRQKRVTYGQRCRPVSLDAYSLDNVSVYNSVRRKGGMRASKRSYGNPAFDDPVSISHQMSFQALAKFNDNIEEITAEFEEIPQVTARASEVPPGCETKNRYANIIPLPETRVFLKPSDNDPHSDYINANYVTGPKNTQGYYIACQAPMDNTIDDFWRMIWEQQCRVVLMLTNLFENGVEKCADYLPPSEVLDCHRLFGDFQITLKKRDVKEKYIISSLQLKNMVSNSWREITHLWYLGWPERGVPSEANSLIAFLIEARSHLKAASNNNNARDDKDSETPLHIQSTRGADGGPVVVHCSPGTGRTGTVIACDIAVRDFELTRAVDIPKIVYRVRRDRASAVQTRDQYAFIYKLITLYATKLTGGALDSI